MANRHQDFFVTFYIFKMNGVVTKLVHSMSLCSFEFISTENINMSAEFYIVVN